MKSYGVVNAEQLAERFEIRARIANRVDAREEARTWRAAADLLRDIEFVGWKQQEEERE